jgi:hypothetical protein
VAERREHIDFLIEVPAKLGAEASRKQSAKTEEGRRPVMLTSPRIINQGASMINQFGFAFRRISVAFAVACLTALLSSAPAAAQGTVAQRQGCEGDAFKFCSNYIPFVHQIENCLYRNMRNLTPACRVQMQGGTPQARRRR